MTLHDELANELATMRERETEAVSVFVVTDNPDIARAVAPLLATNLYHPRRFSDVLHVERAEHDGVFGFEIAVAVDDRIVVERGFYRP